MPGCAPSRYPRAMTGPIAVAALYRFARIDAPRARQAPLARLACGLGVKGTLILAEEGINGTLAGTRDALGTVVAEIAGWPGFAGLDVKWSAAPEMPFRRLKVRVKPEIVTLGRPEADPNRAVGAYVEPRDWNALLDDPGTAVVDARNDYETAIGRFEGAIDPGTASFRDFPAWWAREGAGLAGKRVAMYCTGGIRCEKATSFLLAHGVGEVLHLKGGILRYLETVPEAESRWRGDCFVFDGRVSVGHGMRPGGHALCHACGWAVSASDRLSPHYREGVSCPACAGRFSEADRARFAERQRQIALGRARGVPHLAGD